MPRDLVLRGVSGEVLIGDGHKTFIIAEIGQNHQGDLLLAKKLVLAAKEAGADCVKFQRTCFPARFTQVAFERPYDNDNSFGRTYGEHRRQLEFSDAEFSILKKYSTSIDMMFTASAMDCRSLEKMAAMNVPFIKLGSGDANNFPLIEKAAKLNIPLVVSTGMQTMETVDKIYNIIRAHHTNFVLMHCVSAYPTPLADANLNLIGVYKERYPSVHIGYSGHELGSIVHLAVAAGAKVIERHITLDKTFKGSDHACSLDCQEFKEMVDEVRRIEVIMGSYKKTILPSELPCRNKLGKSLVAAREMTAGVILTENDILVKISYPIGIPGERIQDLVGLQLTKDYEQDGVLDFKFLQDPSKNLTTEEVL